MIPKVIHYCWFGRNSKPASVKKCIESWKKYCPDYQLIEWNEDNFSININLYCKQAYDMKKWAFVSDYARLWIIYHYGGIYLDTDVEIIRSWDSLLKHDCFLGRQPGFQINTGVGFGAIKEHPLIKRMMDDYEDIPFIKENGEMDLWTCPHRNSQWLFAHGLKKEDVYQEIADAAIYPIEFFSPKDAWSRKTIKTSNTYSIHHCDGTWNPNETRKEHLKRYLTNSVSHFIDYIVHFPNRVLRKLLGNVRYEQLKKKWKG